MFRVDLHVVHGRYQFLPRWSKARHLHVTVRERNARLSVKGSGRLGGVSVPRLSVQAGPLGTSKGVVSVHIQGRGDLDALLAVVLPHVPRHLRRFVPRSLSGQGPARLSLALHIPFASEDPLTLQGTVGLAGAMLRYPWTGGLLHFRKLAGSVGFTENGPNTGQLTGTVLGGPFALSLKPHDQDIIAKAHGSMSAAGLQRVTGAASPYVQGPMSWRLQMTNGRRFRVVAQADLRHVVVHLPYPAGKALDVPAVAHAHLLVDKRGTFFRAGIPRHLHFAYRVPLGRPPATWVGVGSALPPKVLHPGLAVGVRSAYLDASVWERFVAGLTKIRGLSHPNPHLGVRTLVPRAVHLYVSSFVLAGRPLGMVRAHLVRVGTVWRAVVQGPDVLGTIDWRPQGQGALLLSFQRLVIPLATAPVRGRGFLGLTNPRSLPAVQFIANSLTVDGRDLGRVAIDGAPYPDGFRFGRVLLTRHRTTVSGQGQWTLHGGQQESTFALIFYSQNLGRILGSWGLPHQVDGGHATAHAALNWPGGPTNFSLDRLNANIQFVASHGQFVQVRQGAGKLLGIFNVDSIVRYLTLDFSSIFGRGFSFNHIDGKLLVQRGVAVTKGIHVQGASADILVSGQAGLAAQTFNLIVDVNPHLQNNVTLATGLIGGPVAGAAVLLMQKIFANEINQGTRLTYFIKGPWSKPIIRRTAEKN